MKRNYAGTREFYDIEGPIAIAHRGGNAAGPDKENSMVAFQSVADLGIIYVETDTIATKDGTPLAFHGSNSEKMALKTGLPLRSLIQSMTFKEVESDIRVGGERIPSLEEVLTTFPEMRFFIDPKTAEVVEPLAKLIGNVVGARERVSIGAFAKSRTKAVTDLLGGENEIPTSHAVLGTVAMLGLKTALTAPLVRPYFEASGASSLQVPYHLVTEKVVERAHGMGVALIVWPFKPKLNDNLDYINGALDLGVHGLMSDHTQLMVDTIVARDPGNASIKR